MSSYTHSGYNNLFRPPYNLAEKNNRASIYCVSNTYADILFIIPLCPVFYEDAIKVAQTCPALNIYFVAADIGVLFISDYYQAYRTITDTLKKKVRIFSMYPSENTVPADFKSDIFSTTNNVFSIDVPLSEVDNGTITVELVQSNVNAGSDFACDIILKDTQKTRLFACEMNSVKAEYCIANPTIYDEIHMPYISGSYGGDTYNKLINDYPALYNKLYCNQFGSTIEFNYAIEHGIKLGEVYTP